jgi:hypothetical protein
MYWKMKVNDKVRVVKGDYNGKISFIKSEVELVKDEKRDHMGEDR